MADHICSLFVLWPYRPVYGITDRKWPLNPIIATPEMSIKKEVCYSLSKIMFMNSRTKVEENYVDNRFRSSFSASISTDVSIQFMLDQNFIPILRITALLISLKVNISNYPSPRTLLKEIDLWYEQYITLIRHLIRKRSGKNK